MERLEPVGRGKYEVFEGGVGVLQVFVLAKVEIGLGAYGLPLNLAYLLQKKIDV